MLRPAEFFRALNPAVPFAKPLTFFLVFSIVGSVASTLSWMANFPDVLGGIFRPDDMTGLLGGSADIWFSFFVSPFLALMGLAINIAFTHVGVLIFIPTRKKVGVTARTYCYVAAPSVIALVPFVGLLVSLVWAVTLSIVGIRWTHGTSAGRAAAAVLVPPFAIAFGFGLLIVLLIFLAIALGGQV